jgi:hypothetical protein
VAKDAFMGEIELPNLFRPFSPFRAMEKAELFFAKGRCPLLLFSALSGLKNTDLLIYRSLIFLRKS